MVFFISERPKHYKLNLCQNNVWIYQNKCRLVIVLIHIYIDENTTFGGNLNILFSPSPTASIDFPRTTSTCLQNGINIDLY